MPVNKSTVGKRSPVFPDRKDLAKKQKSTMVVDTLTQPDLGSDDSLLKKHILYSMLHLAKNLWAATFFFKMTYTAEYPFGKHFRSMSLIERYRTEYLPRCTDPSVLSNFYARAKHDAEFLLVSYNRFLNSFYSDENMPMRILEKSYSDSSADYPLAKILNKVFSHRDDLRQNTLESLFRLYLNDLKECASSDRYNRYAAFMFITPFSILVKSIVNSSSLSATQFDSLLSLTWCVMKSIESFYEFIAKPFSDYRFNKLASCAGDIGESEVLSLEEFSNIGSIRDNQTRTDVTDMALQDNHKMLFEFDHYPKSHQLDELNIDERILNGDSAKPGSLYWCNEGKNRGRFGVVLKQQATLSVKDFPISYSSQGSELQKGWLRLAFWYMNALCNQNTPHLSGAAFSNVSFDAVVKNNNGYVLRLSILDKKEKPAYNALTDFYFFLLHQQQVWLVQNSSCVVHTGIGNTLEINPSSSKPVLLSQFILNSIGRIDRNELSGQTYSISIPMNNFVLKKIFSLYLKSFLHSYNKSNSLDVNFEMLNPDDETDDNQQVSFNINFSGNIQDAIYRVCFDLYNMLSIPKGYIKTKHVLVLRDLIGENFSVSSQEVAPVYSSSSIVEYKENLHDNPVMFKPNGLIYSIDVIRRANFSTEEEFSNCVNLIRGKLKIWARQHAKSKKFRIVLNRINPENFQLRAFDFKALSRFYLEIQYELRQNNLNSILDFSVANVRLFISPLSSVKPKRRVVECEYADVTSVDNPCSTLNNFILDPQFYINYKSVGFKSSNNEASIYSMILSRGVALENCCKPYPLVSNGLPVNDDADFHLDTPSLTSSYFKCNGRKNLKQSIDNFHKNLALSLTIPGFMALTRHYFTETNFVLSLNITDESKSSQSIGVTALNSDDLGDLTQWRVVEIYVKYKSYVENGSSLAKIKNTKTGSTRFLKSSSRGLVTFVNVTNDFRLRSKTIVHVIPFVRDYSVFPTPDASFSDDDLAKRLYNFYSTMQIEFSNNKPNSFLSSEHSQSSGSDSAGVAASELSLLGV